MNLKQNESNQKRQNDSDYKQRNQFNHLISNKFNKKSINFPSTVQTDQNNEVINILSRKPSIGNQQMTTDSSQLNLNDKKKTLSIQEDHRFQLQQNQQQGNSSSKNSHFKLNLDYFTLSQQVCKNQKLMFSEKASPNASAAQTPRRNSNLAVLRDAVDVYNNTVQKLVTDRLELNRTKNRFSSRQGENLSHSPPRKKIKSLGRQQRVQQQMEREYFSQLFENEESQQISKKKRLLTFLGVTKVDFKKSNFQQNKIRQQILKDDLDIKQYSKTLVDKGLVESEESTALDTRLKIQKFFLNEKISSEHKKKCFDKLTNEFNYQNQKYSKEKALEVSQMLVTLKKFYLNKHNRNQNSSQKQRLFKKGSYTSSQGAEDQDLTSQVTTFYKTRRIEGQKQMKDESLNNVKNIKHLKFSDEVYYNQPQQY